jgi:hypothetical protein
MNLSFFKLRRSPVKNPGSRLKPSIGSHTKIRAFSGLFKDLIRITFFLLNLDTFLFRLRFFEFNLSPVIFEASGANSVGWQPIFGCFTLLTY